MEAVTNTVFTGSQVRLNTSDSLHFNENGEIPQKIQGPNDSFSKVLFDTINQANSLQQNSDELEEKMVMHPEQVNIDEVMIASEKARLSVSFFKSITDKAIRAYNEIMMIR
jgi:flagellar hook-basal body complex protein FliE